MMIVFLTHRKLFECHRILIISINKNYIMEHIQQLVELQIRLYNLRNQNDNHSSIMKKNKVEIKYNDNDSQKITQQKANTKK
jgi:hypothetical protein